MIVLEHDQVEVDYCVSCEGVWLDAGELELLAREAAGVAMLSADAPAAKSAEKKRRCPICGRKMAKNQSRGEHPVVYDRCPKGDGLWFDRGELALLLDHGELNGDDIVKPFLRQVFGKPTSNR
jgi:Zn-finger nucleic acid-binding protein